MTDREIVLDVINNGGLPDWTHCVYALHANGEKCCGSLDEAEETATKILADLVADGSIESYPYWEPPHHEELILYRTVKGV